MVLAGVDVSLDKNNNTIKTWFYFDPNFGLVKYPTEGAMRKGIETSLYSGRSRALLDSYGVDRTKPEYKYAEFNELELMNSTQSLNSLHGLFNRAI